MRSKLPSGVRLHPPEVPGSLSWYAKKCRCTECRDANSKVARDRRRRRAEGWLGPHDLVPAQDAVEALIAMRDAGMIWDGMAALIGVDRRDLNRLVSRRPEVMTKRLHDAILAAADRLDDEPDLARLRCKIFDEGDRVRWMINCLLARGWTSEWIGQQVGWTHRLSTTTIQYDSVHVNTWARIEGVFKSVHTEWGPSRMSAVRAWRAGKFPSDCYDWEDSEPDYRPIPGTLHPDLVVEACQYQWKWKYRGREKLAEMHAKWGQWESERCATAALRNWHRVVHGSDEPDDGDLREVCRLVRHEHNILPAVWRAEGC